MASAILHDTPEAITNVRGDLPDDLLRLIGRCLEKDPQRRLPTASEIRGALRALARQAEDGTADAEPGPPPMPGQSDERRPAPSLAIAVLPFTDLSATKDQEYLCEGMAEEIMTALVGIPGIRVASRTSTFRAGREGKGLAAVADALSVSHILEGSVRTSGSHLRATAQLTDVASGFQIWSERFDRDAVDIFAVQDAIASGVVEAVKATLRAGPRTVVHRPRGANIGAYRAFLKGRHLRHTKNDFRGALASFEEAVRLDPSHAPSWVGLADAVTIGAVYGSVAPRDACATAKAALATAHGLQGESADGLQAEGAVAYLERRWQAWESAYRRAMAIQPDHVQALGQFGMTLGTRLRIDEARAVLERLREIDPLGVVPHAFSGAAFVAAGQLEESLFHFENAAAIEPDHTLALWGSAVANVALGRVDEGIATLERGVAVTHRSAHFVGVLGWALATAGRIDEANALLRELRDAPCRGTCGRGRGVVARCAWRGRGRVQSAGPRGRRAAGPAVLRRVADLRRAARRPEVLGAARETGDGVACLCRPWLRDRLIWAWLLVAGLSAPAAAQTVTTASMAGVVKDDSGAVLAGVTVEAVSPALIERSRTATTDALGVFRIVDLRPGTYVVTFARAGFTGYRREGVVLTTGATTTVNVVMQVGALEDTVVVSGALPLVDTQGVIQRRVLAREVRDALPLPSNSGAYVAIIPGASQPAANQDVGGNMGENRQQFTIHGSRLTDFQQLRDGQFFGTLVAAGNFMSSVNPMAVEEVGILTGGLGAESESGGAQVNVVARAGGNVYSGSFYGTVGDSSLQAGNVDDALRARGVTTSPFIKSSYELAGGVGGPIKRDTLWFFASARRWISQSYQPGNYFNKTQGTLFYTPDPDRPAYEDNFYNEVAARVTWQVTPRHKVTGAFSNEYNCNCFFGIQAGTLSPEAAGDDLYEPNWRAQVGWTFPVTSKLLLEAGGTVVEGLVVRRLTGGTYDDISVLDIARNYRYGSAGGPITLFPQAWGPRASAFGQFNTRFVASYVTGSHAFRAGIQYRLGHNEQELTINHNQTYTFRGTVPQSVTYFAGPYASDVGQRTVGAFAQDQWTIGRTTLNLGLRFDYLKGWVPEQYLPAGDFVPERYFAEVPDALNWKDLNPRLGIAYDLFGTGKTALKATLGRYVSFQPNVGTARRPESVERDDQQFDADVERRQRGLHSAGARTRAAVGGQLRTDRPGDHLRRRGDARLADAGLQLAGLGVDSAPASRQPLGRSRLLPHLVRQLPGHRQPRDHTGRFRSVLRPRPDRSSPSELRAVRLRPLRHQAGELWSRQQLRDQGVHLRRPEGSLHGRRPHGRRPHEGALPVRRRQHWQHAHRQLLRGGFPPGQLLVGQPPRGGPLSVPQPRAVGRRHAAQVVGGLHAALGGADERDLPEHRRHSARGQLRRLECRDSCRRSAAIWARAVTPRCARRPRPWI